MSAVRPLTADAHRRWFFDVSFTRTQNGNVGITRTVRQQLAHLHHLLSEQGESFVPVAFHSTGFRQADTKFSAGQTSTTHAARNFAARLLRHLHGGWVRRLATSLLPDPVLRWAWERHSAWTFDRLSANEEPIVFQPGDVLLLPDESWNYRAWRAAELASRQGALIVLTCYDLIPIRHPSFCTPLFSGVFKTWLIEMLARSDAVVCISQATRDDLARFCAEVGVREPALGHFRLGSDVPAEGAPRPGREQLRAFLVGGTPCFVAVGTIEPRKNYGLLLEVFDRLWARGIDVKLLIAGRPHAESSELVKRMKKHPQQGGRLLTLHDVSDEELQLAYSSCRALLFPSLAEGFGLPLVEARGLGCAVIASDLPALIELRDGGVSYFARDNADELESLVRQRAGMRHDERPAAMAAFTWRDSASQYLSAVRHLLGALPEPR